MTVVLVTHYVSMQAADQNEITPYKYAPGENCSYTIPASARYIAQRTDIHAPDIVYYLSKPKVSSYPIAFLCGGSSSRNDVKSIIHFHRHLLQEFIDLNVAVLTIEQRGVDGDAIDIQEFMDHYTRSNRLLDHRSVIDHVIINPPTGWDGTFVFLGASEGGPLVTQLTQDYATRTRATINWCGAAGWSWREELWVFVQAIHKNGPWWLKLLNRMPRWVPLPFLCSLCGLYISYIPTDRSEFDACMDKTVENPTSAQEFLGMTYAYHADALQQNVRYEKIITPFLVVAGDKDSIIGSCDAFIQQAQAAHVPITYIRVPDMDHYIRKRPDIVENSFAWLQEQLVS